MSRPSRAKGKAVVNVVASVVANVVVTALVRLLLWLPPRHVSLRVSEGLSHLLWRLWRPKRRHQLVSQIRATLTEVNPRTAQKIARESFSLLPQNLAEIGHPNTLGDGSQDSLSIVKTELSAELSDKIKPLLAKQAIFVSGHFASWEVACIALNRQMSH
ncbi:MAG: hypothetical protein OD811_00260, partial [Alphaproteobacteria bacterium]